MVDVNFGFLCNELEVVGTSFNASGIGWDTVIPPHLPLDFPPFYAVIGLRFSPHEMGEHSVGVRVEDIDGNSIGAAYTQSFTPEAPLPTHFYRNHREQIQIVNLKFPKNGDYLVIWSLDGEDVHRAHIAVLPPTTSP
ncbi:MAG: hypothetical protein IH872_12560 [Chloroflexi bacterium]|nr:hypothetical protein [Chloroflexota bacterium]